MLISEKQLAANRGNAQHSTGPQTPEGKAVVARNALKYGLRTGHIIIFDEDPEVYKRLWDDLLADWQPQTRTERLLVEQMSVSQWMLGRVATDESRAFSFEAPFEKQMALLGVIATLRRGYERSFTSAMHELQKLQQERQSRQPQPLLVEPKAAPPQIVLPQPVLPEPPAPRPESPIPAHVYVMSGATSSDQTLHAAATTDTR